MTVVVSKRMPSAVYMWDNVLKWSCRHNLIFAVRVNVVLEFSQVYTQKAESYIIVVLNDSLYLV